MRRVGSLALLVLAAAGCGSATGPVDYGGEDGKQIAVLVEEFNDEHFTPQRLKALFVAGTPAGPKEAKAFALYRYDLKGRPDLAGDAATATVTIESHKGGPAVDKQWSFVKERDKWKIKAAPLP